MGKIAVNGLSSDEIDSLVRIRIISVLLILEFRKQEEKSEFSLRILGIKFRLDKKDKNEKKKKKNLKQDNSKNKDIMEEEKSDSKPKVNMNEERNTFEDKSDKEKNNNNENAFLKFIKKAREKIHSLIHFLKMIKGKKEKYVKLYETESFKQAFSKLKSVFPKLIKHIAPRKVKGNIRVGFEQCDSTGKFFGYYSVICSYFTYDLKVIPDFENEVFEGEIGFKGRFSPVYLIWYSLGFLLNNDVKLTYKRFKKINRR